MTEATRIVTIVTQCTALVEETWTMQVPADLDVDEYRALDILSRPSLFGAEVVAVEDRTVGEEGDRDVVGIHLVSDA